MKLSLWAMNLVEDVIHNTEGKEMYQINCTDLHDAAKKIYRFMTMPSLTRPECSFWSEKGIPVSITNDGKGFMLEKDFCKKVITSNCVAVLCVASTDKTDKRRVVLNYILGLNMMVLNFPSANGKPNEAEKRLFKALAS